MDAWWKEKFEEEIEKAKSDECARIQEVIERAVNAGYGTDSLHALLAKAAAEEIIYHKPIPWDLYRQFGRM